MNKEIQNTLGASCQVRNEHSLTQNASLRMDGRVLLCPSIILLGEIQIL
jgi:hypothetical protein